MEPTLIGTTAVLAAAASRVACEWLKGRTAVRLAELERRSQHTSARKAKARNKRGIHHGTRMRGDEGHDDNRSCPLTELGGTARG